MTTSGALGFCGEPRSCLLHPPHQLTMLGGHACHLRAPFRSLGDQGHPPLRQAAPGPSLGPPHTAPRRPSAWAQNHGISPHSMSCRIVISPGEKSQLRFCCAKNMFLRVSGTLRNPPGTTTKTTMPRTQKTRHTPHRIQPQPRESLATRTVKKEWASMTEIRFWKSCFTISNRSSDRPRFAWPP